MRQDLCTLLRERRLAIGMTQQRLAQLADVSLATLQNIEAARANPEISTLDKLARELGLDVQIVPQKADWAQWSHLGLPLMLMHDRPAPAARNSRDVLVSELIRISQHLDEVRPRTREGDALRAFFIAIRDHYPSVWRLTPKSIHLWVRKNPLDRRLIKLRRMAISRLSEYL